MKIIIKKCLSIVICLSVILSVCTGTAFANYSAEVASVLPYQDTSLSFEVRAADLVSRMTLEEKAQQTGRSAPAINRLGVHSYNYWSEGIHGVARQGAATSFPSSLSMSNTWDRQLVYDTMDITGEEARGKNNRYNLSYWNPTINIGRDPRWGRNEESYGEDPYITSEMATQAIAGMRGTDDKYLRVATVLKHIAANNCEGERQTGTSVMNEKTFREYYVRAFEDTIYNVQPEQIMSSYNALSIYRNGEILESDDGQKIDYVGATANKYLFKDYIRRNVGFNGVVVGDCGAWENLYGRLAIRQKLFPNELLDDITATRTTSAAYDATQDLDCGNVAQLYTQSAIEKGEMTEEQLDIAVYRLMLMRMKLGEFDNGAAYQDIKSNVIETDEHVAVAEKAAEESWVLLKNDGILPLNNTIKNVAVVGSLSDEIIIGDYSGSPTKTTTPYEGIKAQVQKLNSGAEVNLVGSVSKTTPLFNIKSISFVLKDGKKRAIDISNAESVTGMNKSGSMFTDITKSASAVIKSVDFSNVKSVEVEMSTGSRMGGALNISYESATNTMATIHTQPTSDEHTYVTCSGEYGVNGDDGGYNKTGVDMYITVSAALPEFTVEEYKEQLDNADVIIAYASTIPKGSGLGDPDASESKDRASILLPAHESHVQAVADAYPNKTVVVMQTVGQIDVSPFENKCKGMLWTSYNGQTQGEALGKILTGAVNPSGKLTQTWYQPSDLEKMPIGSPKTKENSIDYNYTNYELAQDINNTDADWPGRTYQYYNTESVYPFGYGTSYTSFTYSNIALDKNSVDANDTVTVTADIENTGSVKGAEVVQLYVTAPGADGKTIPLKQLKGFERVELNPGEKKTVSMKLNMSDIYFFDEFTQRNYVLNGEYTIKVAANADDKNALTAKLNVSGTLSENIKNIYTIPSGVKLYSVSVNGVQTHANEITTETSIALDDNYIYFNASELDNAKVTYISSNSDVAVVDENGIIKSGGSEGTSVITASAEYNGRTVTSTFPVVTLYRDKVADSIIAEYSEKLDAEFAQYTSDAYTNDNWAVMTEIYNSAKSDIENGLLEERIKKVYDDAVAAFKNVESIILIQEYTIVSDNENVIKKGIIDYSADGIGEITADGAAISGSYTKDCPCRVSLNAVVNGIKADASKLNWSVEKLDLSGRRATEIDGSTGQLTLYENGIFKITVKNFEDKLYGELIVFSNLQLEAESADGLSSANIITQKDGVSGGKAVNTSSNWIRFDGVKLERLNELLFRVSSESDNNTIKVSLSASDERIVGSASVPNTNSFNSWSTVSIQLNRHEISKLKLDDYGCGTIYVQANSVYIDYMLGKYINSDIDAIARPNGKLEITVPYDHGILITTKYDSDGQKLTDAHLDEIKTAGTVTLDGYNDGDKLKIFIWDSLATITPLTSAVEMTYLKPTVKELTEYIMDASDFDIFAESGPKQYLSSGIGLYGYGGWGSNKKTRTYEYTTGKGKVINYKITRGFKGGKGSKEECCMFFIPDSDCLATVLFDPNGTRTMYIEQDGKTVSRTGVEGEAGTLIPLEMEVKAGSPVYVYGGGANKFVYGIILDTNKKLSGVSSDLIEKTDSSRTLYAKNENSSIEINGDKIKTDNSELRFNDTYDADVTFTKLITYNGAFVGVTKNNSTNETRVVTSVRGNVWTDITPEYFDESDLGVNEAVHINDIISVGDQMYLGCDNGILVTITSCAKCSVARRVCGFDIEALDYTENVIELYGDNKEANIELSEARQYDIKKDAAIALAENGAILVDVRSNEEFTEKSYEGSINVPIDSFEEWLDTITDDQVIIVYCSFGTRSEKAVKIAEKLGKINIYNLGSIDNLLSE